MHPVKNHRVVRPDPLPETQEGGAPTASIEPATRRGALGDSQQSVPHREDRGAPAAFP